MGDDTLSIRSAEAADLDALLGIEQQCFEIDRLSRRSFRYHLRSEYSELLVATLRSDGNSRGVLGYALCLLHKGTRMARLYSLAVLPEARGMAIAQQLLAECEGRAEQRDKLFMRLEVAESNSAAIKLYQRSGYKKFGEYQDYYEDHQDAVRMQKTIRQAHNRAKTLPAIWYPQTTDFTCGPAALLMAMSVFADEIEANQAAEIELWREATTVFMTSGLGGTHPFGLALAAQRRGFDVSVWVNTEDALFLDGVRTVKKKEVMSLVHAQFEQQCSERQLPIIYQDVTQEHLQQWLNKGWAVMMLISTYRLDGKKAPHWVMLTGIDLQCLYVHDPDVEENWQQAIDCQHVPIARQDFEKMSAFGSSRLRCAIVLRAYHRSQG